MKLALVLVGAAAAVSLAGCGTTKKALGLEKSAPDEFRIVTKAPLIMPPDFSLRPPRPGEARPEVLDNAGAESTQAVFGDNTGQNASPGEKLLVAKADATTVDPNIGEQVDFEGADLVRKPEAYADKVLAPNPSTATATTDEQESIRRVTGGGAVTIEPGRGGATPTKLPGL
jgi:Protein of unknown function (DUF3035)